MTNTDAQQNAIKAQAQEHERFRKMCISLAQRIHKADITMRMRLMGEQGTAKVRPLNDKRAIESGATFLSETFVFAVAGSIIIFEANRQRQKELTRRESVEDDIKTLQHEIEYLKRKLKEYNVRLDDYTPLKDLKPLVLRLDDNGDSVDLQTQVQELNSRLDALDRKVEPSIQAHLTKDSQGKLALDTKLEHSEASRGEHIT